MNIPFSLPVIEQPEIDEMMDTLKNTGWLTTGPKTRALEAEIGKFLGQSNVLCVNSWTSGAMLMLRWFGVGYGDEVIIPAYTYSATALCVMNMGATPVMVDVLDDFTIDPEKIKAAITSKTKAIITVDLGGLPCDYDAIRQVAEAPEALSRFTPESERQKQLGRVLILADAAHSLGASYKGKMIGACADVTIFSLHSVKNITTGEGGAIVLNMPDPFDNAAEHAFLKALSLNGQNKSAFEKNIPGSWRYDIIDQGLKVNMPDLCAAIGLSQMRRYASTLLPQRKEIYNYYVKSFTHCDWVEMPISQTDTRESSYHLFLLRVKAFTYSQRDEMIRLIAEQGVGVNVHYIPMPMLTLFKERGYRMEDYPRTFALYQNEITLPVYNGLTVDQLERIVEVVKNAYESVNKNV